METNDADRNRVRASAIPDSSGPHVIDAQPSVSSSESRAKFAEYDHKLQRISDSVKRDNLAVWVKQAGVVIGGFLAVEMCTADIYFQWFDKHYQAPEMMVVIAVSLLTGSLFDFLAQWLRNRVQK